MIGALVNFTQTKGVELKGRVIDKISMVNGSKDDTTPLVITGYLIDTGEKVHSIQYWRITQIISLT